MFPTFCNPDLNEKKFNDPCKLFYRMFRNLYKIHGNQAIGLLDFRVRKNDGRDRLVPSGAIGNNLFEVGAEQRWEPLCKRTLDQSNLLTPPTLTLAQLLKNPIQKPGAAAEDVPESSDAYLNLSAATPLSEKSPADVTNLSWL